MSAAKVMSAAAAKTVAATSETMTAATEMAAKTEMTAATETAATETAAATETTASEASGGAHAVLSPSAAERWLHCTPSARLEAEVPRRETEAMLEGTLAHALAAQRLRVVAADLAVLAAPRNAAAVRAEAELLASGDAETAAALVRLRTPEMEEAVGVYVRTVAEAVASAREVSGRGVRLLVEERLDVSRYVPWGFGTADAVVLGPGRLTVLDLKYGRGVAVDARENAQLMIYGLGALERYGSELGVTEVRLVVVQPRLGALSSWTVGAETLRAWGRYWLRPQAEAAWAGRGALAEGPWCQFCAVRARCARLAEAAGEALAEAEVEARLLSDAQVEALLPRMGLLRSWTEAVEAYATERAVAGRRWAGWKLVEGRTVRRVADAEGLTAALRAAGYAEEAFLRTTELRPLGEIERLVGRAEAGRLVAPYVERPAGRPTLVPEGDRRRELVPEGEAFAGLDTAK